ncbi:hypothetical protein [Rathayibacter soli]|uniref:hypothetical protein n=1 Tax=Rathayibacter soli TaxID=3144168 RepID=UPI0027E45E7F|nr:hypothetical protein [Glaciibacter superstes]
MSVDPLLTHTSGARVAVMTGVLDAGALGLALLTPDVVVVVVVLGAVVAGAGVLTGLGPSIIPVAGVTPAAGVVTVPVLGVLGSDASEGEDAPSAGAPVGAWLELLVAVSAGVEAAVVEAAGAEAAGTEAAGAEAEGTAAAAAGAAAAAAAGAGAAVAAGASAGVAEGSSDASTGHDWPGSSVGAIRPLVVCSRPRK